MSRFSAVVRSCFACVLIASAGTTAAFDCPADPATDAIYPNWPQSTRDWVDGSFALTHISSANYRCGLYIGISEAQSGQGLPLAELQAAADQLQPSHGTYTFTGKVSCVTQRNSTTWAVTTVYKFDRLLSNGSIQKLNKAVDIYNGVANRACDVPQNTSRDRGQCSAENSGCTNPINVAVGNKYQHEVDYVGAGAFPLRFERHYNSKSADLRTMSIGWSSTYSRTVVMIAPDVANVSRDDGRIFRYTRSGAGQPWTTYSDIPGTLAQLTDASGNLTGWTYLNANDELESYNTRGALTFIVDRAGRAQTLAYSSLLLASVTDSDGRTLQFTYDASGRLSTMTNPAGGVYTYAYTGTSVVNSNLTSATYPGGAVRQYVYGESANVSATPNPGVYYNHALTGLIDENSDRFATWTFDSAGRASSSTHAGGANEYTVSYGSSSPTGSSASVTDPLGSSRTYVYDRSSNVSKNTSITGAACSNCGAAATTYDANGFVASRTDRNGNLTCYTNNSRGLEIQRVEGLSGTGTCASQIPTSATRTIDTTWHSTLRLPTQIDEAGRSTTFTHDSDGNVLTRTVTDLTVTPNVSRTWTFTYNSVGRVLTADGPRTDVTDETTYTYYGAIASCGTTTSGASSTGCRGQLETVTNALSHVTTYDEYNAHGQPVKITDPNGLVTTLAYDSRQRLTSRTVGSETTAFEYWATGLLKKVSLPDDSYLLYTYDDAHRLTGIEDAEGNSIQYTLDDMGNRIEEKTYDPTSYLVRQRYRVYNSVNRLWKEIGSANSAAVTTAMTYDDHGNVTDIDAPLSRSTDQAYDALNRLTGITDPESGVTQFAYDDTDNLVSVTDPRSKVTSYEYNGFGDLVEQTSPDTGVTTLTYDSAGNVDSVTDARSETGLYTYDALNRVTELEFADETITYTYDTGTNNKGRLIEVEDDSGSTGWAYDSHGRVTGKAQAMGVTKSVGYGYNGDGQLAAITTPSGQILTYSYTNNRISGITLNSTTTLLSNVTYDPLGPANGWTWGNSTLAVRNHDQDGLITDIDSAGLYEYTYDDAFRITNIDDDDDVNRSWAYDYDLLDRLTEGARTGLTQTWTYDANGNRLTQGGTASSTFTISGTSNRLSSVSGALSRSYSYDSAGHVTGDGTNTLTYSDRGRLIGVSGGASASYGVNALGQRVKKVAGGVTTYFVYDEAGHLVGEYDGSGDLIQETVWLNDIPVAVLKPNGGGVSVFYVHTDHLNTPRRISRPGDNVVVWRWDSDAFGTTAANQDPDGDSTNFVYGLRFPGQYFDSETGLHYNYMRDYDPLIGRYAQSDPIGLAGGVNTYAYVDGDPVSRVDPHGLMGFGGRAPADYRYPPGTGPGTFRGPFGPVCGSGPRAHWIPDWKWETACANHDRCYQQCGVSRLDCDLDFLAESGNIYYFMAVRSFGREPFRKAQAAHCQSCGSVDDR